VDVAEEAATFDVLTGDNYILGVGLGYRQLEFDAFGVNLNLRGADLEKYKSTGAELNHGEAGAASRQRRTKEKAP
jgi:alkanesulfonate monooxygenase SsuD/methylene tetrahydromethanopterin reductase-like flavin-dependent oxidoreductase (luciferase family)